MDDEIAAALSRLLLVSGSPRKAKEYLEAFTSQENSATSGSSTASSVNVDLTTTAVLPSIPLLLLSPTGNPWGEGGDIFTSATRPAVLSPRSDAASFHVSEPSPPTTPRHQSEHLPRTEVPSTPSSRVMRCAPSPAPSVSTLSQWSDQPQTPCNPLLTPIRNPVQSNPSHGLPPSPTATRSTPQNGPRTSDRLHPDIAAVNWFDSRLSKTDFKAVKSAIRLDPDYVGELPYIKVQNPQYEIKTLVYAPPKHGNGRWYQVSRGTSVGIFNNWNPAAKATQGVPKAVHKSFKTRGEAIVAFQVSLLRGEVLLMNERPMGGEE